jgi:protein phosphatase
MLESFLRAFEPALSVDVMKAGARNNTFLSLPRFSPVVVARICRDAGQLFAIEDTLLELSSPILIVGDIHGQILDLVRIIQTCGRPPDVRYLFLGDLVDRGEFSLESVLLIFVLKLLFPSHIYLIRGNHEFDSSTREFGFESELLQVYADRRVYESFMRAFSVIPLAATIDRHVLCIHGGIGPMLVSLSQIRTLQRPIDVAESALISQMLWSDPSDETSEFAESPRGSGCLFGHFAFQRFLGEGNLRAVVRGHQCMPEGVTAHFDGQCITVFSASNYCGRKGNDGGVLKITPDQPSEPITFPPIGFLPRACAEFVPFPDPLELVHQTKHSSRSLAPRASTLSSGRATRSLTPQHFPVLGHVLVEPRRHPGRHSDQMIGHIGPIIGSLPHGARPPPV